MSTLRGLLVVLLVFAGFGAIFVGAVSKSWGMAGPMLAVCLALIAALVVLDRRLASEASARERELARAQSRWSGDELVVPVRWARAIVMSLLAIALSAGGFALANLSKSGVAGGWLGGLLGLLFGWFALLMLGNLVRVARAGYALALDRQGIRVPGWRPFAWAKVHGTAVTTLHHRGRKTMVMHLLVGDLGDVRRKTPGRLLFGPLEGLWGRGNEVRINAAHFDVHEERLRAALRTLGQRHAPRFDAYWFSGTPLETALRSADESRARELALAELEVANQDALALARTARDEHDPKLREALRRLEGAMAESQRRTDALVRQVGEQTAQIQRQTREFVRVVKWLTVVAVIAFAVLFAARYWARTVA